MGAYLALFARVMAEGAAEEVPTWLRQLEEDAGGKMGRGSFFPAPPCSLGSVPPSAPHVSTLIPSTSPPTPTPHPLSPHPSPPGISPVWEPLFQAMCCPVPQDLKAALDRALASLARRPDLAGVLWERLGAAVVVAPLGGGAEAAAMPRYDITYQLNEIEVSRHWEGRA